ncbi:predicted protein [Histoplasma capsulatum var. duboisii H88]|uniref:Predicted protein n=1 Tax=Ajellomyces capsulatus (strain H88) TaxID=544711 RepID=F0USZ3_AJEC8|nr:predicted protein [Histoplasma capsulatum var. duboisii H88]
MSPPFWINFISTPQRDSVAGRGTPAVKMNGGFGLIHDRPCQQCYTSEYPEIGFVPPCIGGAIDELFARATARANQGPTSDILRTHFGRSHRSIYQFPHRHDHSSRDACTDWCPASEEYQRNMIRNIYGDPVPYKLTPSPCPPSDTAIPRTLPQRVQRIKPHECALGIAYLLEIGDLNHHRYMATQLAAKLGR